MQNGKPEIQIENSKPKPRTPKSEI